MPYVQRDFLGRVIGVFSGPAIQEDGFCLTDPDPLPEDHPDIVAFFAEHPLPQFPPPTDREFREAQDRHARNQNEIDSLQNRTLALLQVWSGLELAMSGFLQQLLNLKPPMLNVARAIYFSIPGFDQRVTTVSKALEQFVQDHLDADRNKYAELKHLVESWRRVQPILRDAKNTRNVVAHGSISVIPHGGTYNARITAPVFDPIKVGALIKKGSNPGLGVGEMDRAVKLAHQLARSIDRLTDSVTYFHQFGIDAVLKERPRLEANLMTLESLK